MPASARADRPDATGTVPDLVAALRATFARGTTLAIDARLDALADLRRGIVAEQGALEAALAADLGKSAEESRITEIGPVVAEIDHMRRHLRSWLRPTRLRPGLLLARPPAAHPRPHADRLAPARPLSRRRSSRSPTKVEGTSPPGRLQCHC